MVVAIFFEKMQRHSDYLAISVFIAGKFKCLKIYSNSSKRKPTIYGVYGESAIVPARMKDITGGKGATIIFDPVAGALLEKLADAAAQGAVIFQYGALSTAPTPFPLFQAIGKGLSVRGCTLFEIAWDRKVLFFNKHLP